MDTGLDSIKNASRKVVHKASKFMGNKTADTVTKSNDDNIEKQEPVEETFWEKHYKNGTLQNI